MSRIQHILEKAEREGAAMRTSRVATASAVADPVALNAPTPPSVSDAVIVPGTSVGPIPAGDSLGFANASTPRGSIAAAEPEAFSVRLNPLLVAGLAPKSPAAEQYRALRTRLAHVEGAQNLRSILITSPQKGEGKS